MWKYKRVCQVPARVCMSEHAKRVSSILIKLYYATISIIPLCRCAVVLNTDPLSLHSRAAGIIRRVCAPKRRRNFNPLKLFDTENLCCWEKSILQPAGDTISLWMWVNWHLVICAPMLACDILILLRWMYVYAPWERVKRFYWHSCLTVRHHSFSI